MKYTITINQVGIVRAGLHEKTDMVDWAIIDYLKDWFFMESKKTILEDGKQYTWVNYNHLLVSNPLLGIKDKHAIVKRFKKLRKLNLIKTQQQKDNSLYFMLTEFCINTAFYQEQKEEQRNEGGCATEIAQGVTEIAQGYATPVAQGVCYSGSTAQVVYQSNSININNKFKKFEEPKNLSNNLPSWLDVSLWEDYVEMRKKIKRPLTERAKILAIEKLESLRANGNDPNKVLEQSIFNSYQGLFSLKEKTIIKEDIPPERIEKPPERTEKPNAEENKKIIKELINRLAEMKQFS